MLREDLIPYSFGGNKVRKAINFFDDIINNKYDLIITYGSNSSNHVRIIANMAYQHNLKCIVISPINKQEDSFNRNLIRYLDVELIEVEIENVSRTIEAQMKQYKKKGFKPYFIEGGGHGNPGTKAYIDVFEQITKYEKDNEVSFDYIFFATGTGTTQAGLIIGNIINKSNKNIIGISIARQREYLKKIILQSIDKYIKQELTSDNIKYNENECIVIDDFILDGYGKYNQKIINVIKEQYRINGIPLDTTYTGKAFWGMGEYIKTNKVRNKNILFIHTGGTPIFFDDIKGED